MLEVVHVTILAVLLSGAASAQSTSSPVFLDHALVKHGGSEVTIVANDSTPLFQAISALRLEFGWQINWESAPGYSRFDVADDTDSKWRAAHPNEKGVTRPAGGLFTASFAEPSDPKGERDALVKLIDEYNATENPGKYVLLVDPTGQLTVVGKQIRDDTGALREVSPLLDTQITLPKASRNVYETIESILDAVQSATGKKILLATVSSSLFINTQVAMGGETHPARDLLKQALASTKRELQYDLSFNPDVPVFILALSPVLRESDDGAGGKRVLQANRPAKP